MTKLMRIAALLLCLALCFTACAYAEAVEEPDAETFEALMAVNTSRGMLSRHANWEMSYLTYLDGEEVFAEYNYRDAGNYLWVYVGQAATLCRPDLRVDAYLEEEGPFYSLILFDTMDACRDAFEATMDSDPVVLPEDEILVKTVNAGDGLFVAYTEITDPALLENLFSVSASKGGYSEGAALRFCYTFDMETSDLLSNEAVVVDAQGETHPYEYCEFAYDVEPCDFAGEDSLYKEYFTAEEVGTVIITFAPGTADEHTISWEMPHGVGFSIYYNGAYVQEIFADAECTTPFEGGAEDNVMKFFVK